MTSRLDDRTNDFIPATLNYNLDASTFWANYNTFIKLQNVIAQGSGQTWNTVAIPICKIKKESKTQWFQLCNICLYDSNTRNMLVLAC